MSPKTLGLFEGYGIEIESMIVDSTSLDPLPLADELLRTAAKADEWVEDHDDGAIGWSNELVAHVIELKTNGPAPGFRGLAQEFLASSRRAGAILAAKGARLMPTGMHPWMDPTRETRLWPHDTGPVYRAYDQLFDCHRHGWANLQSVHLNLSFRGEAEFAALMAAVRIALPLIPALAASSPFVEGRATGLLDNRLEVYRTNSERTPSMTGDVIPEPIYSFEEYQRKIFGGIDRELEALGADPILRRQEWTNARGAIARFDRMAIEVRLIDAQECASADLAVAAAVTGIVRALVEERSVSHVDQRAVPTELLLGLLSRTIAEGPAARLEDPAFAVLFGQRGASVRTAGDLLQRLTERSFEGAPELGDALEIQQREGTLAERILVATGPEPDRAALRAVYGALCDCQEAGQLFQP